MITIPTLLKSVRLSRVGGRVTHVQLILATLARACPPSMQLRTQKDTPFMTKSRLGSMTP